MTRDLSKLWFSQASLSAWLNCPLKFKYRYVDGLYWPLAAGGPISKTIELGRRFHLLAQRYFSSGEAEVPAGEDPLLEQWLAALKKYLPRSGDCRFLPEYELRSARKSMRLLAKYDLLVVGEKGIAIYDWKTEARAPRETLAATAQTRLYLYLLSSVPEYFALDPAATTMVYWNPRFPGQPLTLRYSQQQREQDEAWLQKLTAEILSTAAFPATGRERNCRFCEYRPVCHGQGLEELEEEIELDEVDWEQIQEIVLQGVNLP